MRLRIGRPRCLLVIAPHPDDETIGAYGLILRLRRCGATVRVLIVTDGRASHPNSPTWNRARLVRERQRESLRAVRRIGVTAGNVTFLGFPDGDLSAFATAARRRIAAALHRAPKPLLMVAPARSDDHPDHRVVAAATTVRIVGVRTLRYPVWPAGAQLRGARTLRLTTQERLAKRHAIHSYRTQTGRITDDPTGFAMTRTQIAAFSRPAETFLEAP